MWPTTPGANSLGSLLSSLGVNLGQGAGMGYPAYGVTPGSAPGSPRVGTAYFRGGGPQVTTGSAAPMPTTAAPPTMPPTNAQPFGNIGAGMGYPAAGVSPPASPGVLPGAYPAMFGPSTFPPSPSPTRSVGGPVAAVQPGSAVTRTAVPATARAQAPAPGGSPFGTVQYGAGRNAPIYTALMLNRLFGR